jgi:hypothetical protein
MGEEKEKPTSIHSLYSLLKFKTPTFLIEAGIPSSHSYVCKKKGCFSIFSVHGIVLTSTVNEHGLTFSPCVDTCPVTQMFHVQYFTIGVESKSSYFFPAA